MDINYINLFNEPFILKNIKEQLTDVDFNKNITQFRILPDEVTSIFTDIFLNDSNSNLLKFINFTYNCINTHILIHLNNKLHEQGEQYIMHDEEVFLIFKGGNNMLFLQKYINNVKIPNLNDRKIKKELNNNFKISDCDFTIYIICRDINRYYKIYNVVKKLLVESLQNISIIMEQKLNSCDLNGNPRITEILDQQKDELDNIEIKSEEHSLFYWFLFYKNIIKELSNDENYYIKLLLKFLKKQSNIKELSSLHILGIICHMLNAIKISGKYPNPVPEPVPEIYFDYDNLFIRINNKINQLYISQHTKLDGIYTTDKLGLLKNTIIKKINENHKNKFLYKIFDKLKGYKIVKNIIYDDIHITQKKNFLVKNQDTFDENIGYKIFDGTEEKVHYITANNIIIDNNVKGNLLLSFDLYRIQFNVQLKNDNKVIKTTNDIDELRELNDADLVRDDIEKISIPSEFVDVSIPSFNDSIFTQLRDEYYENNIIHEKFNILCCDELQIDDILIYSFSEILHDLNNVLFIVSITPIFDSKYSKRISRYIFFYIISKLINITTDTDIQNTVNNIDNLLIFLNELKNNLDSDIYIKLSNNIISSLYKDEYANIINNSNFNDILLNLLIFFPNINKIFNVKEDFHDIELLLNNLLIFYYIIKLNNQELFIKICNLNNIENASFDDFKNNFKNLIKTIIDLIDIYIEYLNILTYNLGFSGGYRYMLIKGGFDLNNSNPENIITSKIIKDGKIIKDIKHNDEKIIKDIKQKDENILLQIFNRYKTNNKFNLKSDIKLSIKLIKCNDKYINEIKEIININKTSVKFAYNYVNKYTDIIDFY